MPFLLLGCAAPQEIREAQIERDRVVCDELGFEPGSENFNLCLLLQDTNRRIDQTNQRLYLMETDLRRLDLFGWPRFRHW